jgi:hypothetical protein
MRGKEKEREGVREIMRGKEKEREGVREIMRNDAPRMRADGGCGGRCASRMWSVIAVCCVVIIV